jgi:phosphatidylinositol-bisphosphatase
MELLNDYPYFILSSNEELFLQYQNYSPKSYLNKVISVNLFTSVVKSENPEILKEKIIYSTQKAKAILGIINIKNTNFILYITSSEKVGQFKDQDVFRITEVDFFEISDPKKQRINNQEISDLKDGIKKLLKLGFYYSFGVDLTSSQQYQSRILTDLKSGMKQIFKKDNLDSNYMNNMNQAQNFYKMNIRRENTNKYGINENIEESLKQIYLTSCEKYFFNKNLYKKFLDPTSNNPIDPCFIIPIICGYFGTFSYEIDGSTLYFTLISRRSQNHCGTRYNTRGINDDGHVANFCESEQIVIYKNNILSFSQLRGSVPVFFQQIGLRAATDITRNRNLTIEAFSKHLAEMREDYPLIYFIDLLNQKKKGEALIIANFEKQIKFRKGNKTFRYYYFDMQNQCPRDDYSKIDYLMQCVETPINVFQFFSEDLSTHEILKQQKGTTRTNCLDCLDRTNVIQTRISWLVLQKMLYYLNLNVQNIFDKEEKFFSLTNNKFKENFKDLWAENGDEISIQYAGTASTITTVTKTGGHNLMGLIQHGIATVSRIYQGSFEDYFKQECIDTFLQKNLADDFVNPVIYNELRKKKEEFTKYMNFFIYIGNWNLSGKELENDIDIINWLTAYKENNLCPEEIEEENLNINDLDKNKYNLGNSSNLFLFKSANTFDNNDQNYCKDIIKSDVKKILPEFYILGFQEIVDLTSKNILLSSNEDKKNKIKTKLTNILKGMKGTESDSYQIVTELDLVGIYIIIFAKKSIIKYIKNFDYQIIKTGFMGSIGNKGACLLRFNINDSKIAIACNHLSAGQELYESRRTEITDVLNTSFKKYPNINFKDYDYYFFFGDLNSRISLDYSNELIDDILKNHSKTLNGDFNNIIIHDQIKKYQKESSLILQMDEAPIKFSPTYKYIIGSNEYDKNKKRIPSWTDRILFKKFSETSPLAYNKCLLSLSDHQPIYGVYRIKTEEINKDKKQKIMNQIIKEKSQNLKGIDGKNKLTNEEIEENFFL